MTSNEIPIHKFARRSTRCSACNNQISVCKHPEISLRAELASVYDQKNGVLCLRCLERKLGRPLTAIDVDESHRCTLEGYVTSKLLRDRIGPRLTLPGLETLEALYRSDIANGTTFRDFAEPLFSDFGFDNRCMEREQRCDRPHWLAEEAPTERWALFNHDADPWAMMLVRIFDDGRSAICAKFQLAYSHPFRKNVTRVDIGSFIDACEALTSRLFTNPVMAIPAKVSRMALMSATDARYRLVTILDEVVYPCTPVGGREHYGALAPVLGNPSSETLSYVGDLAYGESHLPSPQFLSRKANGLKLVRKRSWSAPELRV